MTKRKETPKELAEAHWAWLSSYMNTVLGRTYIDAFIHGYGHGEESVKIRTIIKDTQGRLLEEK